MGLDDLLKEGEGAVDGQTSADQQVANQQAGGHESVEDTAVDSGKRALVFPSNVMPRDANAACAIYSRRRDR
jgi:hypothetical protein